MFCDLTSTIGPVTTLTPLGQRLAFTFAAPRGLYQFSVLIDAREFDWEQLYETLNKYHNVNQRTGPWDFSINFGATPLVPAYWVTVNGKRLGLWFFERVSLEDIEHKRFRGKFAFYAEGETTVELELFDAQERILKSLEDLKHAIVPNAETIDDPPAPPSYDRSGLNWILARLEVDPEDRLEGLPATAKDARNAPAARWADPAYWQRLREGLDGRYALYREGLERAFDWVMDQEGHDANALMVLLAAWRLGEREGALDRLLALVDDIIARPSWGNPNPAGYSHNGDMAAATSLRVLAFAYHAVAEHLGDERRARLLDKLRVQGEIFFHLTLLNRDYWGGSVLQDHGWQAVFGFGVAALHLLGILPEAGRWAEYCLPRLRRCVAAMPRDGVLPLTSYQTMYLYLDEVPEYRDTLLALTGEDLYDQPQFRLILDYVLTTLDTRTSQMLVTGWDTIPLIGGARFLNQMAAKFGDGRAVWLQERLQQVVQGSFFHGTQLHGYYQGAVAGLLSHEHDVAAQTPPPPPLLTHFEDSGLVHYRDDAHGLTLSVRCGPFAGYHGYRHSLCSCDRLDTVPAAGHFTLLLEGVPLLCTPDGGYSLKSVLRSCLLIDGQGQYGDIGYPMSIPSKLHGGEQVQFVNWDEATQTGLVRLFLTPAYPEALGVAHYTRDFLLAPGQVTMRDTVVLDEPRRLSWLFQGKRDRGLTLDGQTAIFGAGPRLQLTPVQTGLTASVHETPIVWSYASTNDFQPFDHVRYDSTDPLRSVIIDFVISPKV